jgi:hypothetical protein
MIGRHVTMASEPKWDGFRFCSPEHTEDSIRVDHVSESPNVGDDDRAVPPLRGPVRLAVQVEEPT